MFKHILVPTDGSELSQKAIDGAIDLAQSVGARITAYACLPQYPYSPFADVAVEPPGDFHARAEAEAREHLRAVELAARRVGVACDSRHQRAIRALYRHHRGGGARAGAM